MSKTMNRILLKIILVSILLTGILHYFAGTIEVVKTNKQQEVSEMLETAKFYNEELFYKGEFDKYDMKVSGTTKGAIVPHHNLAGRYLSGFFTSLSGRPIKTVVLIGPDHKATSFGTFYSADVSWNTEFGPVHSDLELVESLVNKGIVNKNNKLLGDEHSIVALMPYFARYIPEVKIVPLVVNETKLESIKKYADDIAIHITEGVLVIAAVDFSHYLNIEEVVAKDLETLSAINSRDHAKLLSYGNDHLDSPTSIVLLDLIMQNLGKGKLDVLVHSNSFILTGRRDQVTSYLIGVYD